MRTRVVRIIFPAMMVLLGVKSVLQAAAPETKPGSSNPAPQAINAGPTSTCKVGSSVAELDINNVRARYMNQGDMFWDAVSNAKYEVPKRTDNSTTAKMSMFAAAIWIGGLEKSSGNSNLITMVQTYRGGGSLRNYWPGPIQYTNATSPIPTSPAICLAWDRHFKCNRRTVVEFLDLLAITPRPIPIAKIPKEILLWPGKGNPHLKNSPGFAGDAGARNSLDYHDMANFFDSDTNGVYDPVKGDYPLWAGTEADIECNTDIRVSAGADQVIWWVCNDAGNIKNFEDNAITSGPIGMEVHYEAFAYAATDATNDMTFLRQKLYNWGSVTLDSTYMAQWADPDLGNPNDDYVGCDVMRGLGICYNGDDFDEGSNGYGENPPAVGVDFFRGPFPDDSLDGIDWDRDCRNETNDKRERITMSGFVYYNIGGNPKNGDPTRANHFYNYLRNIWKDGTDITYGSNGTLAGQKVKFMFGKDTDPYGFTCGATRCDAPVPCGTDWSEEQAGNAKGDRRFLCNNGPFTLKPGDVNECTIGIPWARTGSGGAKGSLGKLLAADDLAQERFDECFQRNVGPNNPNLEILEQSGNLVFTIIPDTIQRNPLMTTESYSELNRKVVNSSNGQDIFYRFQGYKIYQLIDDKVSVQDLNNADKARLIKADVNGDGISDMNGLMDVKDNISSISNLEYVQEYDQSLKVPKVKDSPDQGIFRSFIVTEDMFASSSGGTLSDFRKYYYAIVAYGFCNNDQATLPYLQGVTNYKIYTAIPHSYTPHVFGTVAPAKFGQGFDITRIRGIGNSGNSLTLAAGEEERIISNIQVDNLTYSAGNSPVDIKVYNPPALRNGKFQIAISSRLRYRPVSGGYNFQVGDIIVSRTQDALPMRPGQRLTNRYNYLPGRARVERVVAVPGESGAFDLDIKLLGSSNGTWKYQLDSIFQQTTNGDFYLATSETRYSDVVLEQDPNIFYPTIEYVQGDFWKLTELNSRRVFIGQQPISTITEQLIPEFGISLRMKQGEDAGSDPYESTKNGALTSEITYTEPPFWSFGIGPDLYQWHRNEPTDYYAAAKSKIYYNIDPTRSYFGAAGGSWVPYTLTLAADNAPPTNGLPKGGAQFSADVNDTKPFPKYDADNSSVIQSVSRLGNVDVVFTPDRSKWTRCMVLQNDPERGGLFQIKALVMTKSEQPSIDINGRPTNALSPYQKEGSSYPSTGMSWFPGYAIDIDKGVRLNMMFSESRLTDIFNGNDLQWQPTFPFGGKSFVFIANSAYDECRSLEYRQDSILRNLTYPSNSFQQAKFLPVQRQFYLDNITWVGLMGRVPKDNNSLFELNQSEIRARLRVEKGFKSFANSGDQVNDDLNPLYEFEISGEQAQAHVNSVGSSALDMIRVVPNPYYAVSGYETSQIDNRIKIVNLPTQCVISIFNLSGTLVRQFKFDQSATQGYVSNQDGVNKYSRNGYNYQTYQDWDLKNQNGIPIASGVYLIHIKSDKLGEKVVKWFGVLRPIDLDSFN